MKVKLTLKGLEEIHIDGKPREVLRKADEILVKWKVI